MLIMMLSSASPAHAQTSSTSGIPGVIVTEQIQPLYDVYGGNTNQVRISINESVFLVSGSSFTMTTLIKPTVVLSINASSTTSPPEGGEFVTTITLTPNTTSFSITYHGSVSGSSFLWRYLVGAPYVAFTGLSATPQYSVTVPSGTILSQVYTGRGGTLPLDDAPVKSSGAGQVTYSVFGPAVAGLLIF